MTQSSAASQVLFLDFDGVLHPEPVFFHPRRGVYLGPEAHGHTLFEHASLLVSVLAPYPDVKIVLATSWVQHRSYSKAVKRLPLELQRRVVGATFHAAHMTRDNWFALSRGVQVLGDVGRRRPTHWVALDDDDVDWPENYRNHLVKTDAMLGLTRPGAVDELRNHLESWFADPIAPAAHTIPVAAGEDEAANLVLAHDAISGLREALSGQFVSDDGLDDALGIKPTQ